MTTSTRVPNADGQTAERIGAITRFGLTERQARFLATVMFHSGVFVGRQYAAFAGITHGQRVHEFIERLVARKFVTPIQLGSTGRTRIFRRTASSPAHASTRNDARSPTGRAAAA